MTDLKTINLADLIVGVPNSGFWYGLGFGVLIGIGYKCVRGVKSSLKLNKAVEEWLDSIDDISDWEQTVDNDPRGLDNYRLVLVVRTDLSMARRKVAEHCSHAAVTAYQQALKKNPILLREWMKDGQPKVTLRVDSEEKLDELYWRAEYYRFTTNVVHDVSPSRRDDVGGGRYDLGVKTVLAIGPMFVHEYEYLVKDLEPY